MWCLDNLDSAHSRQHGTVSTVSRAQHVAAELCAVVRAQAKQGRRTAVTKAKRSNVWRAELRLARPRVAPRGATRARACAGGRGALR
jgi:hypothetical protein